MSDYFKNDEYWKEHINDELEDDIWLDEYKQYFQSGGDCLDLGCGIGQYTEKLMEYGYTVVSSDISDIALNRVKEFNPNVVKVDMEEELPFDDNQFDLVFANLSIHYFSDEITKSLMKEVSRILKPNGLFIGSVKGIKGSETLMSTGEEIEPHFYYKKNKYMRLFDRQDLEHYLNEFEILDIEEGESVRFGERKNYYMFFCKSKTKIKQKCKK